MRMVSVKTLYAAWTLAHSIAPACRLGPGQTLPPNEDTGRLIYVSDFISPLTGRAVIRDESGNVVKDARRIIYPGPSGDLWWNSRQVIAQVRDLLAIHEEAHPGKTALCVFDHSPTHTTLPPDGLNAFGMNMSDGGKQRRQRDTVIPQSNPDIACRGRAQRMTLEDGQTPKGLRTVLEERGFNVRGMRAKCVPACSPENNACCMARLLSKQDDFAQQPTELESLITEAGHLCIYLPKYHCELNPIEMVSECSDTAPNSTHTRAALLPVLGVGEVSLPRSPEEIVPARPGTCPRSTGCLSARSHSSFHQPRVEVHERLPRRPDRKGGRGGCATASTHG